MCVRIHYRECAVGGDEVIGFDCCGRTLGGSSCLGGGVTPDKDSLPS